MPLSKPGLGLGKQNTVKQNKGGRQALPTIEATVPNTESGGSKYMKDRGRGQPWKYLNGKDGRTPGTSPGSATCQLCDLTQLGSSVLWVS